MKLVGSLAFVLSLLAATSAYAATAYWTGQWVQVQTVTFKTGWKCQYNYNGQTFWQVFDHACPATVEVQ